MPLSHRVVQVHIVFILYRGDMDQVLALRVLRVQRRQIDPAAAECPAAGGKQYIAADRSYGKDAAKHISRAVAILYRLT